jgi:hypothetical protein
LDSISPSQCSSDLKPTLIELRQAVRFPGGLRNKPEKNPSRYIRPDCGHLTFHPVDRATALLVMFACCVEAPQRTVIALLETCQITATTRG